MSVMLELDEEDDGRRLAGGGWSAENPVVVTLPRTSNESQRCVWWNNATADWDTSGCESHAELGVLVCACPRRAEGLGG